MKLNQRQTGFTLLELIVVIAIMAIFAGISVPAYLIYIPKARLDGAARMVMVDLMAARMKAVRLNARTQVFFLNDHQYMVCDDANQDKTVEKDEGMALLRDIQTEYKDVTFITTNDPEFLPRGSATNLATITLENASGVKKVTVAITGRIKQS